MNELLKIHKSEIQNEVVNSVNARDLHEGLEIKQDFTHWIKKQVQRAELEEDKDFLTLVKKDGRQILNEYILTIDSAKHIVMMSQSKQAKKYRDYLIDVEKRYIESLRSNSHEMMPFMLEMQKTNQMMLQTLSVMNEGLHQMLGSLKNTERKVWQIGKDGSLSKDERRDLSEVIQRRGEQLAIKHGISLENATANVFRAIAKEFNVRSYSDISSEDFSRAHQIAQLIEINGEKTWTQSEIVNI
jgi:anti-repressor protein